MEITLKELLDSREARASYQRELLREYGGMLLSVTLNIPGPVKDRPKYRDALRFCVQIIQKDFGPAVKRTELRFPPAGPEAFVSLDASLTAQSVKARTVAIEDGSPIGRLFDIDVLTEEGGCARRTAEGRPARRCFICGAEAKLCARSRRHGLDDLLAAVEELLQNL